MQTTTARPVKSSWLTAKWQRIKDRFAGRKPDAAAPSLLAKVTGLWGTKRRLLVTGCMPAATGQAARARRNRVARRRMHRDMTNASRQAQRRAEA